MYDLRDLRTKTKITTRRVVRFFPMRKMIWNVILTDYFRRKDSNKAKVKLNVWVNILFVPTCNGDSFLKFEKKQKKIKFFKKKNQHFSPLTQHCVVLLTGVIIMVMLVCAKCSTCAHQQQQHKKFFQFFHNLRRFSPKKNLSLTL